MQLPSAWLGHHTATFDWRQRLRAAAVHLGLSALVALLAAVLVFFLWYPYPYRVISGGRELFQLVVGVDVIVGPLITFAIFDRAKPRTELRRDLEATFGIELFDHIGEAQIGPVAGECRAHEGMHLHARDLFCEFLDPETGLPMVTVLAPYTHLAASWRLVCTRLGVATGELPRANASIAIPVEVTDRARQMVGRRYARDVTLYRDAVARWNAQHAAGPRLGAA